MTAKWDLYTHFSMFHNGTFPMISDAPMFDKVKVKHKDQRIPMKTQMKHL